MKTHHKPGGNRLTVLAAEIVTAHGEARAAARLSLNKAMEVGEALTEAKSLLTHGEWLPWLREHCDLSERTAQQYMRLAKHREVIAVENRNAADLSIRGAIDSLTELRWPSHPLRPKPSQIIRTIQPLPIAGHVKIALRESAAGFDEVWIAPSYQHHNFYHVTHIWTPKAGIGSITGTRLPVKADMVHIFVSLHLSEDMTAVRVFPDVTWSERPCRPWAFNVFLFANAEDFVDNLDGTDELAQVATEQITTDQPSYSKAQMQPTTPARPLVEILDSDGEQR